MSELAKVQTFGRIVKVNAKDQTVEGVGADETPDERRIYHDNRGNAYMRQHGTFYRRGVKLNKKARAAARRAGAAK